MVRIARFLKSERGCVSSELAAVLKIPLFCLFLMSGMLSERVNWAFDEVAFFIHGGTRETQAAGAPPGGYNEQSGTGIPVGVGWSTAACQGNCESGSDPLVSLSTSPPIVTLIP